VRRFQVNIEDIPSPFYQEQDEIYWLELDFGPLPFIGWKETDQNWNDDAVFWYGEWVELRDPMFGTSLDLAFVITSEVEYTPKMHWPQTPKEGGWDVAFYPPEGRLADDWLCTRTGEVDDIHFWVSWMHDMVEPIHGFAIRIWSNNPQGPLGWSVPDVLLWERFVDTDDFTIIEMEPDIQGWFGPVQGEVYPDDHILWFQVNVEDIQDPFYQYEGDIYWLEIDFADVLPFIGWKETDQNWNDDAVYYMAPFWWEIRDPFLMTSIDLAFMLNCCGMYTGGWTGNTNCDTDGKRNLADITRLIDHVYVSTDPLCCRANGNTNGDLAGAINLADITRLIDLVYVSGAQTAPCP
jgi:hypothetical protein